MFLLCFPAILFGRRVGEERKMAEGQENQKEPKEERGRGKKRKEVFVYGNYRHYYGYRVDGNVAEDPRLSVLKKEWFEGKDCLDVGCNQGLLTISIAKKFSCRSILGVDVDASLIECAKCNLRNMARKENANSRSQKVLDPQISNSSSSLQNVSESSNEEASKSLNDASLPKHGRLLDRVSFQRENFVESLHGCSEKYDTILCLSVTKWIHLNWGDNGLITLFVKIWRLLRLGGILILEPQPWSSYKKNRMVSETARANFNNILLHPQLFREILLDKVGFRSAEDVSDGLSGAVTGFDRPVMAFRK